MLHLRAGCGHIAFKPFLKLARIDGSVAELPLRTHGVYVHLVAFDRHDLAGANFTGSSLALANSRRSRMFSASRSDTGRRAMTAEPWVTGINPFLCRAQLVTVDCGTQSLLAAALPPIDSASPTVFTLNFCVESRFVPFRSSVHQTQTNF